MTHYKTDRLDLRLMDCMELMREYPDKYFELAIVDVPYGLGMGEAINSITGGIKFTPKKWDSKPPEKEYFQELRRVSKNQIVWGANHFIDKIPLSTPCWIVWDKNNGKSHFADAELAWASFTTPVRVVKIHWCGSAAINETGRNKIHGCQKPVALYRWLLANYAKAGDKILDTHLGSMSSVIAALDCGYHITGSELDSDYFEAGIKRVNDYLRQETFDFAKNPILLSCGKTGKHKQDLQVDLPLL